MIKAVELKPFSRNIFRAMKILKSKNIKSPWQRCRIHQHIHGVVVSAIKIVAENDLGFFRDRACWRLRTFFWSGRSRIRSGWRCGVLLSLSPRGNMIQQRTDNHECRKISNMRHSKNVIRLRHKGYSKLWGCMHSLSYASEWENILHSFRLLEITT